MLGGGVRRAMERRGGGGEMDDGGRMGKGRHRPPYTAPRCTAACTASATVLPSARSAWRRRSPPAPRGQTVNAAAPR
jgi:hypothetical protein